MKKKQFKKMFRRATAFLENRDESGSVGRYAFKQGTCVADRISLINHLNRIYGYKDYLEIGTRNKSDMHNRIDAKSRTSVDPDPKAGADYCVTSDEFFANNSKKFDLIFIDGLHTGEQVYRDIDGALEALNPGGVVLLHDLNPPTAFHAREHYEVDGDFPAWNGTSWQGYARHRAESPNLEMYVVDVDWGVGFVRPGRQICYPKVVSDYGDLERDRVSILNLITVRDFLRRHPSKRLKRSAWDPLLSRF